MLAKYSGDVTAMTAYVTTLLGQISLIYERDLQVHLRVNVIQAWATADPYSSTSPLGQLNEVGDWWHANRPKASYPRTVVHFLSGKPVSGGIAWLDVLCINDFSQGGHWGGAYGVTQVNAAYPANPWDLIAVSHELGHNFGSPHTHCYSPPLDQCYNGEPGCYSGSVVNPGPLGGTIMSYCHLLGGGYGNLDLRFHERCITEHFRLTSERAGKPYQALFGVIQGAQYEDLRRKACRDLGAMNFDGFGIGGALEKENLGTIVRWCNEELPENKPRHLLGISEPDDIFTAIENGADTFDCVSPTRVARNSAFYHPTGRYNLSGAMYKRDFGPLQEGCDCYACLNYSRAYIQHLFKAKEMVSATLISIHNERFVVKMVDDARLAIEAGNFFEFRDETLDRYYF